MTHHVQHITDMNSTEPRHDTQRLKYSGFTTMGVARPMYTSIDADTPVIVVPMRTVGHHSLDP